MTVLRFRDSQHDYVLGPSIHTGLLILGADEQTPYLLVRAADAAPLLARIRWSASQAQLLDTLLPSPSDDREHRLALLVAELDAPMARYQLLRRPRRTRRRAERATGSARTSRRA